MRKIQTKVIKTLNLWENITQVRISKNLTFYRNIVIETVLKLCLLKDYNPEYQIKTEEDENMKIKQEYNDDHNEQSFKDQSYSSFLDNSSNVSVKQEFHQESPTQSQNEGQNEGKASKPKRKKGRPFGKFNFTSCSSSYK